MKIFVTGGKGMLGRTLRRVLTDVEFVVGDLPECDITKAEAVREAIATADVDAVVHCAAMTQVDLCETERERAFLINETGSANVAKACEALGKRLIAISTDYVFRGDKPCDTRNSPIINAELFSYSLKNSRCPNSSQSSNNRFGAFFDVVLPTK